MTLGVARTLFDRLPREIRRTREVDAPVRVKVGQGSQPQVIRLKITRRHALRSLELRGQDLRSNSADHACCDPVLQVDDVVQTTVKSISPDVMPGFSVDQLPGHS